MTRMSTVLLMLVCACALWAAPPAAAVQREAGVTPLEQAREESGIERHPATHFALPAGELDLSASELLAASRDSLRFTVTLNRPVTDGRLELTLPTRWAAESGVSGLDYARVPGGDRSLDLSFSGAGAYESRSVTVRDIGIPAGTYTVRYRWVENGTTTASGTATVIFFAPVREGAEAEGSKNPWARLASPGIEVNATNDGVTESETFISVVPGKRRRFIVGANGGGGFNAWVTNDEGQTFTKATMPTALDAPGEVGPEAGALCCDPMSAADAAGNLWYGGLTFSNGAGNPSRIVVNRIAPGGTSFQPLTVGLPVRTSGTQDKPLMTIDNSPSSPTFGRLYVVWDEPNGGVNIVISQCDTRILPAGTLNAENCDDADNWSPPVTVVGPGSYIYADVAVAPDGKVYVTWWNYSSANAIQGRTCDGATGCATPGAWSTTSTIATLDATGGVALPFACPILAQPGGRASTAPGVEVDRSGGPNNNRVYVTWSDLRTGSGTTRCNGSAAPAGSPQSTHLTFDSFVASAVGALPGSANPSPVVATRLLTDGEGGGQSNSDDWFPWLAIDQTTGQAWADFYSTRDDATRNTTNFYARSVTPDGSGGHTLGTLTKVSGAPSDYSANQCCLFGNDYGDYSGIDAAQGIAIPVWSDKRDAGDGEAFTFVDVVDAVPPDTAITGGPAEGGLSGPNPQFTFTATEAFSTFECQVDAGAFSDCATPFTTSVLGEGGHVVSVRATDPAGNVDPTPATRTFTVDSTPPDTTITSGPAEGSTITTRTPGFGFTATEAGAVFQCSVDGAAFATCSSPQAFAPLTDGPHTFGVRAVDPAGNIDPTPATRAFTVDTTAPETAILSGPAEGSVITDSTPTFGLGSSEAGSTFACALDLGVAVACPASVTLPSLDDGPHTFTAAATDAVGNTDTTPVTRTFTLLRSVGFSSRRSLGTVRTRGRRTVKLRRAKATCPAGTPECSLASRATAKIRGAGRRAKVIGKSKQSISAGGSVRVSLKLTSAARRALRRGQRLRAKVTITGKHGARTTRVRRTVTLRR